MNTIRSIVFVVLVAALPFGVTARQQPAGDSTGSTWRGRVTAVSTRDNTITGKRLWLTETFHVGEHCAISTVNRENALLGDLSPGEKVKIRYQKAAGVLVANRIVEEALRYAGTVGRLDEKARTMTMDEAPLYQPFRAPETFRIASDCKVILWNGHDGTLPESPIESSREVQPWWAQSTLSICLLAP
jgi:hypothetical protein